MAEYKPKTPFSVAAYLMKPTYDDVKGVVRKRYVTKGGPFNCSFRTFGGTEKNINGVIVVEDTATIETWYRQDITSDCVVYLPQSQAAYEIISPPENINMRNQYMTFKVRRLKGDA